VLAIAVAGLAYLTDQASPVPVTAESAFLQLEQDVQAIEVQAAAGQNIPLEVFVELSARTRELAGKLNEAPATAPVAEKLPEIILRQQAVVSQAANVGTTQPGIQQVQDNLVQAEQTVRLLAASAATPTSQAQASAPAPAQPTATMPPATATTAPATATAPAVTTTPAPVATVGAGQIRVSALPGDTTFQMQWLEVRTADISFAIPAGWSTPSVVLGASNVATLNSSQFRIDSPDGKVLAIVNLKTGETIAIVDGKQLALRGEGQDGDPIDVTTLVAQAGAGEATLALFHLVESIDVAAADEDAN
jgi:cytoskeletal protein RodZ